MKNGGSTVAAAELTVSKQGDGYDIRIEIESDAGSRLPAFSQTSFMLTIPKATDEFILSPGVKEFGHSRSESHAARIAAVIEEAGGKLRLRLTTFMVRRSDGGLQVMSFRRRDGTSAGEIERQLEWPKT